MTNAQVVETSVTVNSNSPIHEYVHPGDQTQPAYEMTPGFKPFTEIIIFSKSVEEHLVHFEEVCRRLHVKLNPKKCSFVKQKVEYLAHVVTPEGVSPNLDTEVHVGKEFPTPTSLKGLRNFLGLTNYYTRFVRGFLTYIDTPLNALMTKKGSPLIGRECAVAVDKLRSVP